MSLDREIRILQIERNGERNEERETPFSLVERKKKKKRFTKREGRNNRGTKRERKKMLFYGERDRAWNALAAFWTNPCRLVRV